MGFGVDADAPVGAPAVDQPLITDLLLFPHPSCQNRPRVLQGDLAAGLQDERQLLGRTGQGVEERETERLCSRYQAQAFLISRRVAGWNSTGLRATTLTLELRPELLPGYAPHRAGFHFSRAALKLCNKGSLFIRILDFEALEECFHDLGTIVLVELKRFLENCFHRRAHSVRHTHPHLPRALRILDSDCEENPTPLRSLRFTSVAEGDLGERNEASSRSQRAGDVWLAAPAARPQVSASRSQERREFQLARSCSTSLSKPAALLKRIT